MKSHPLSESADHKDQHKIPQVYYVKSSLFGYTRSLPDILLFWGCIYGIGELSLVLKFFCGLAAALLGYRMTFIVHDCSHRTLFSRKLENEFFGWLCASLLLVSFAEFRRLHWLHHMHYRREIDPQGTDYRGIVPGRDRVLWHLIQPLLLLNLVDKVSKFLARQYCGMTPAEQEATRDSRNCRLNVGPLPIVAIVLAQAVVFVVSTSMLTFLWGYFFVLFPLVMIGLFLSRLRSYLEHGNLEPSHDNLLIARTHRATFLEGNILSSLFFHYHNEHHRWPQVPSRLLPRVHEEVVAGRLRECEYSPTYMHSLRRIIDSSSTGGSRDG